MEESDREEDDARWQADLFRALGEANRLRTMFRLLDGPATAGEIAVAIGAEQSLASHHLAALRQSGLVEARREGRTVLYGVPERVRGALKGKSLDLGCCVVTFRRTPRKRHAARGTPKRSASSRRT